MPLNTSTRSSLRSNITTSVKLSGYFFQGADDRSAAFFDADDFLHDAVGHHLRRWSEAFTLVAKRHVFDKVRFDPDRAVAQD